MTPCLDHALYRGFIRHRRFAPVTHAFRYSIRMLLIDLDKYERLFTPFPILSTGRFSLGWFRRRDYAGPDHHPLKDYILDAVENELGFKPDGKVMLLTHLRYWGVMMNPISVFYCYDKNDQLQAVVLHVSNTPWGEKIIYVQRAAPGKRNQNFIFDKQLHVSPFNPMEMSYQCRLQKPAQRLLVHLENHIGNQKQTDATLVLSHQPLSRNRLILIVLFQPFATLKVFAGIYWNALRLWLKKSPVYDHPDRLKSVNSEANTPTST